MQQSMLSAWAILTNGNRPTTSCFFGSWSFPLPCPSCWFSRNSFGNANRSPVFCSTVFSRPPNRLLLSTAWWFESLQTEILVFGHHHHHLNFTGPETYHLSNSSNHKPVGVSLSKVVSLVGNFLPTGPPLKREDVSGTSNSLTSRGLRPLQPSLLYRWSPSLKTKILHTLQRSFRFFARRNMIIIGLSQLFKGPMTIWTMMNFG